MPQKVCRKCISALRAAFVFREMCQRSDAKLREYFEQNLVSVKEDKFDVYFVDDSCETGKVSQFDNDDYHFCNEQTGEQKVEIENDIKMQADGISMEIRINKVEPSFRPRYNP